MKKKFLSILFLTLVSTVSLSGCGKEKEEQQQPEEEIKYDYTYFNGICALSGEFNNGVDYALTNEWTKQKVQALQAKSARIWIAMSGLFDVKEDNELSVNLKYKTIMEDHVNKLKEAGVKNYLVMYTAYVYPYGYIPSTGYVVPDPNEEYEQYLQFLDLQAKASKKMKEMFPDLNNFEPANEPDFACPGCIHKNGFIYGGGMSVNFNNIFNDDDKVSIILDMCWYIRKAVQEVDPNAKVVFPGLTNQDTVPDFVDLVYKKIESKTLPVNQEKSDTNPDHYFDVLNWHPYPVKLESNGDVKWDEWISFNQSVYDVVKAHKDNGKPVYFSEIGWTDWGSRNEADLNRIANNYTTAIKTIKEQMPYVTAIFPFRLTNLIHQQLDQTGGEENFGLFYHPDDPLTPAQPKPAAYAVAKAFNGEDYNLDEHL